MPELPEVETVCRGLSIELKDRPIIRSVQLHRANLRTIIPPELSQILVGETVLQIRRRAKYILFDTEKISIISHLGMSGSWRFKTNNETRKHDHFSIHFSDGRELIYHDPRRFGIIEYINKGDEAQSRWLRALGVEPLTLDFNAKLMFKLACAKNVAVKSFIMDQKYVVGVGNIYAAEALFLAHISPLKKVSRVSLNDWQRLIKVIRQVLNQSIQLGGTTLKDYRQASGAKGNFQKKLYVYGRAAKPCFKCKTKIKSKVVAGRTTFWCGQCQK